MNSRQSACIDHVRFPLICLIVLVHMPALGTNPDDLFSAIHIALSDGLGNCAVPVFFAISAWLLFQRGAHTGYTHMLRRKATTLLLPYIVWNTLCYVFVRHTPFLLAFWDTGGGYPADPPLWFLRDLITLTIASPAVYAAVRDTPKLAIAFCAALYLVPALPELPHCAAVQYLQSNLGECHTQALSPSPQAQHSPYTASHYSLPHAHRC